MAGISAPTTDGHAGGDGINPVVFSNNESNFSVTQTSNSMALTTFQWTAGSSNTTAKNYVDFDIQGNALFGMDPALFQIFNSYKLVSVTHTYLPRNITVSKVGGENLTYSQPGLLTVAPWTQDQDVSGTIEMDTEVWALSNSKSYAAAISSDPVHASDPTGYQNFAPITVSPMYKLGEEAQSSTSQPIYTNSPVQCYSKEGLDNTLWRGYYIQLKWPVSPGGNNNAEFKVTRYEKWTVQFEGRRLTSIPPGIISHFKQKPALGYNKLGNRHDYQQDRANPKHPPTSGGTSKLSSQLPRLYRIAQALVSEIQKSEAVERVSKRPLRELLGESSEWKETKHKRARSCEEMEAVHNREGDTISEYRCRSPIQEQKDQSGGMCTPNQTGNEEIND